MRIATVIFSYNDPQRALRCYGELLRCKYPGHTLEILDNSRPELVPRTPDTIWLGPENVHHGGMIDFVIRKYTAMAGTDQRYDFVGMLNCDTWGYRPDFLHQMRNHMDKQVGMIGPSVYEGSVWPQMIYRPGISRPSNFVETIAPYYNVDFLKRLQPLIPFEKYGYVDRILSILSLKYGFCNKLVDSAAIYHDGGAGMVEEARGDLQRNWRQSIYDWCQLHPEITHLYDIWPDEIEALTPGNSHART